MPTLPQLPQLILVATGAFKHSLQLDETVEAVIRGLRMSPLPHTALAFPIADGGNGMLDAFLRHGGSRHALTVTGPLGVPVTAAYGVLPDGKTAVVEMALASGLELVKQHDALNASTYGTGELIRAALDSGVMRIIVGLGGSATTDGGAGCLQALGLRLTDREGYPIQAGGIGLTQLANIDKTALHPRLKDVEIIIAADVDNPAVGPNGAAAVFGPQKGALPEDVLQLDAAITHWLTISAHSTGIDALNTPGGGAAGALAAGLMAYTNARIESGIDLLLDYTGFDQALENAALVITGEGKLDAQSMAGKGPVGVARRAKARGIPVIALAGTIDATGEALNEAGITAAWPIVDSVMTLPDALKNGAELLERAAYRLGCTLAICI